ncbi:hypothetical protein SNEBB_003568 [Seison nebaliae]|nr:hypothetical protein SNEBB_003568 [Seison nebaliae]
MFSHRWYVVSVWCNVNCDELSRLSHNQFDAFYEYIKSQMSLHSAQSIKKIDDDVEISDGVETKNQSEFELIGIVVGEYRNIYSCSPEDHRILWPRSKDHTQLNCAYIVSLAVTKSARRLGLASLLVKFYLEEAIRFGCSVCFLHVLSTNFQAINLYRRFNFTESHKLKRYYSINNRREDASCYSILINNSTRFTLSTCFHYYISKTISCLLSTCLCFVPYIAPFYRRLFRHRTRHLNIHYV